MALWINQEYVDDEVFLSEFRQLGGLDIDQHYPAANPEVAAIRRIAEERVVGRVLLRQKAVAQGIAVSPAEVELRREKQWGTSSASVCGTGVRQSIGENLLIEKYCNWLTRHEQRPSRAEVERYYRNRREDFRTSEQVNLLQVIRNINLPREEAAAHDAMQRAEQELNAGVPFRNVADRYSDCGGNVMLGWVKRGEMVAEFEDVAFSLAKGTRSGVFRTVFGLHLLSVTDHKAAGHQPLEEVRSTLARHLLQARKDRTISAVVAAAMQSATIVPAAARP